MMVRYPSTRPDDAALRERLNALAQDADASSTVKVMRSTTSACSGSTGRSG